MSKPQEVTLLQTSRGGALACVRVGEGGAGNQLEQAGARGGELQRDLERMGGSWLGGMWQWEREEKSDGEGDLAVRSGAEMGKS